MTAARSIVYKDCGVFEELRAREYSRLDADNQAYLDFTGSALYAEWQITAHAERLKRTVLGNPHSESGPSLVSTAIINDAKARLLRFLDASPEEYVVCFTANTSAAIRLVAESYPFSPMEGLVLSSDNHNSMNGIREFARAKSAPVRYVQLDNELRLASPLTALRTFAAGGLFGFPAQSNFSGVKHPLSLISDARRLGYTVLLDAAAFLPSNRLSLRRYPADFVALSIYKITGFPTGVGALVARRESLARLIRPWFAGGTVEYASVQHGTHCDVAGACEHLHEHAADDMATDVVHHSASAEHAQHSADHAHDKAYVLRGALNLPMPRPTHWQAIAAPRVERMVPSRLDRPPMAQTHA